MPITLLPDLLINQIAAGEVIENPASVVKELVENSVDANAKKIIVEIKGGGLQLIRVEDDGDGISPDEMELSFARHATSKITSLEDLEKILTMGFRGEALASIGAISKVHMESAKEPLSAYALEVEGGLIKEKTRIAREKGTTIEVRSLFYNVPARKKFQKSLISSIIDVQKVIYKLALANHEVGFTLISQDKKLFSSLPKESLKERIEDILHEEFLQDAIEVCYADGFVRLEGFISHPNQSKKTRAGQYLFINKRAIYSPFISQVVKDGYGTRLSEGGFPQFVLHLFIDSSCIDVNVHPQKKEVRVREEKRVRESIFLAISKAFSKNVKEEILPPSFSFSPYFQKSEQIISCPKEEFIIQPFLPIEPKSSSFFYKELVLLGKYFFIEEMDGRKAIIDLARATLRILFVEESQNVAKQALLLPLVFDLSLEDMAFMEEHKEDFLRRGFEIRALGEKSLAIDAIPSFVESHEVGALLEIFLSDKRDLFSSKKEAISMARFVLARKKNYTLQEAKKIVDALFKTKEPCMDPLGNKILFYLKEEDIEKWMEAKCSTKRE